MAQVLDPVPSDRSDELLLCCYVNATSKIQVARITNIPNWYFERVVFPGQRLIFEALGEAQLEIHTGMMASAILSDRIPCDQLVIQDQESDVPQVVPLEEPELDRPESSPRDLAPTTHPKVVGELVATP
jgi:hypothetical protein